jgi:hypothetical protein
MKPGLILAIAVPIVSVLGVLWAARRSRGGDRRFMGLAYVPAALGWLVMIWAGIGVASSSLGLGVVMILTGGITVLLLARALREAPSGPMSPEHAERMPERWQAYLIWVAIGVPIVFAVVLLIVAIAERFNS